MEDWRRQMRYPPKLSELWKSAKELNLYGYEDDEDEERFLSHRYVLCLQLLLHWQVVYSRIRVFGFVLFTFFQRCRTGVFWQWGRSSSATSPANHEAITTA